MYDSVAKIVAEQEGHLFFPTEKINGEEFSRSFVYEDFVEGARRILQNIDSNETWRGEPCAGIVESEIIRLEENSGYLDKAFLLRSARISSGNYGFRITGNLDEKHIGGF